jgi:hypothetical protein
MRVASQIILEVLRHCTPTTRRLLVSLLCALVLLGIIYGAFIVLRAAKP